MLHDIYIRVHIILTSITMKLNKMYTNSLVCNVHFKIFAIEVAQKHVGTGCIAFHYTTNPL
jgi:hypothetical protein